MSTSGRPSIGLDAEVLLAHSAWLARLARALVVKNDEIDDVVQQTFVQALAKPPSHTTNIRAWLGTIAKNVVRSKRRSDTARAAREIALAPPSPIEDPAEAVERAELRQLVVKTVLDLDEPYRSALILRFFEEMDVGAIGRMTESGQDTVRTRIRRGVIRVREQLERHVRDQARDSTDGGAAALAAMFTQLRRIAAAGGDGGGAVGPSGTLRAAARASGKRAAVATVRRVLVGVAAVAVVAGGWWWVQRSSAPDEVTRSADRTPAPPGRPPPELPAPPVVAERSNESTPTTSSPPIPEPPKPAATNRGVIRGIVKDPEGKPIAGAHVWALASPDHVNGHSLYQFASAATDQIRLEAEGKSLGEWRGTVSDADGNYEIADLSPMRGWQVGAFELGTGANVSETHSFDHDHREFAVDIQLTPGAAFRGTVRDQDGTPIGNAILVLYTRVGNKGAEETLVAASTGREVGQFRIGFRCGTTIELECSAPGFVTAPRSPVKLASHAKETNADFALARRSGTIVRGRVVDVEGRPLDLTSVLAEKFTSMAPLARPYKVALFAIPSDSNASPSVVEAASSHQAIEGRIDYVANTYDVVVPEEFRGKLELRMARTTVGTAELVDPTRPPDLPCDPSQITNEDTSKTFAIRYVDAETKSSIDLQDEVTPPLGDDSRNDFLKIRPNSDLRHGVVNYGCASGTMKIEVHITGYASGLYFVDVPDEPQREPRVLEIPRAQAAVRGVVVHADGTPYAKTPIFIYRKDGDQVIDSSGAQVCTNPDGEFEFAGLAKQEHFVVVSGWPTEAPSVLRVVASDPPPNVQLRGIILPPTQFRVAGKAPPGADPRTSFWLFDADGIPVEGMRNNTALRHCETDEVSVPLVNGRYTARVQRSGYRQRRLDFDVPSGDTIVINLDPVKSR